MALCSTEWHGVISEGYETRGGQRNIVGNLANNIIERHSGKSSENPIEAIWYKIRFIGQSKKGTKKTDHVSF